MPTMPAELRDLIEARLARLAELAPAAAADPQLPALLLASDYLFERLRRQPELLPVLGTPPAVLALEPAEDSLWPARLRQFRHRHSLALIQQDVAGAPLEQVLRHSAWLAGHCTQAALAALARQHAERHGWVRDAAGAPQQLVVMALGKLGGDELNFSSDIDLVFAYPEAGSSDGARVLDGESYFQRLGQRLIQLLGEVTADGFGFRVDMRLRPFGSAGRLVLTFAAMEQYYQRDGRDWERYAWIKARPVAGDLAAGEQLRELLRPFVYRRYLDYTAFDGLREMKALIETEVQRRDLAEHLKLGPGGIREIEFIVQLQQLIRGGREPALRAQGLLPALAALHTRGHIDAAAAQRLEAAYRFLRRLENRLQMLRDEQVHVLPDDALTRARLAAGLGFADWDALYACLAEHRAAVRAEFARVFEARARRTRHTALDVLRGYWRQIEHAADAETLGRAGFDPAADAHARLLGFVRSPGVRALSAPARARMDRLLPELLAAAAVTAQPNLTLERLLGLLQAVLRRPVYLALLDEQPAALQRLVDVLARSALLAERLAAHPLLLDDLLDARASQAPPSHAQLRQDIAAALAGAGADIEAALLALNELRQSVAFRIAQATLFRRQPARDSAAQLADLAGTIVEALLPLAVADLAGSHGVLPGAETTAGLAIIGYGSLGGEELGFGSDLDLVFLFDAAQQGQESNGPRPLEAARYQLRVVQKLLALLSTQTPAGRLYEADLRLRPDGAKGLLLTSVQSFAEYQRERAWTWEHQALVRARPLAGSAALLERFAAVRAEVLARARDPAQVCSEVRAMRQRMRGELDRGSAAGFDLKQGEGGLVDLEFILQAGVLSQAARHPALLMSSRNDALIDACAACGWLDAATANALHEAHQRLLARALDCTLDARPRLVPQDAELEAARQAVITAWRARFG